jgi:ABC-type multidrug transport system permease subunit
LAAWSLAGVAVAGWRFGWEPRGRTTARPAVAAEPVPRAADQTTVLTRTSPGRPSSFRLLLGQLRHALTGLGRERLPVFFAVVFPGILLVLFPAVLPPVTVHGLPMADSLLPGMMAYAVAVAGYVNLPEAVAQARTAGVLKRLGSTPLPRWSYLAGRLASGVVVGWLAAIVLIGLAVSVNGYRISPERLPAVVLGVTAAGVCFGALGLSLLRIMPQARSVTAVSLGTLIPLSFISDVFYIGGELPHALGVAGQALPLKRAVDVLLAALRPDAVGAGFAWVDLAMVAGWAAVGLLFAAAMPWYERG